MDNHYYTGYIKDLISSNFVSIYAIDLMADMMLEFGFENDEIICRNSKPFTSFYEEVQKVIHPDDLKEYIDSFSPNYLQDMKSKGEDVIHSVYRKKEGNNYSWYSNTVKLFDIDGKDVALVLVENANESVKAENNDDVIIEKLKERQKVIFNTVSSALINLNSIVNLNYSTHNMEVKSIIDYVNNIIVDLKDNFPELNEALASNLIENTNQGKDKTIIIADDDDMTRKLLSRTFEDTYKILEAANGQEAIDILKKNDDITDLNKKDKIVGMFLDLNMPEVGGFEVLDYMSSNNLITKIPIIVISGEYDQETRDRAYTHPIADVLEKPFNVQVIKHRIRTLIRLYKSNTSLNEIVVNQHEEIKNVLRTMVKSYMYDCASDLRRISAYMKILTKQIAIDYPEYHLDDERINKIAEAVKYYNIGLYTLPHKMLKKQDFNNDELKIIKSHPNIGVSIFDSVLYRETDRIFNHYAKDIIMYHEENYDGSGYPTGLKTDSIPLVARIASVAIEYNELLKVMNESSIISEIEKKSGTKFNPNVVASLKRAEEKFKEVNKK